MLSDFGTIICPDTYSLWTIDEDSNNSAAPLVYVGDFYWNGESYEKRN
jgi:hypothetical protein